MSDDKRKVLYDQLTKDGYDLGDYDSFSTNLNAEENCKNLYTAITEDGYDVGDYKTFSGKLTRVPSQESGTRQVIDKSDAPNSNAPVIPWQQPQNYVEKSPALGVSPTQHLTDAAIAPVKEMLNNNIAEPVRDENGRSYYPLKPKAVMEDEIRKEYQVEPVDSQIDKAIAANEEEIAKIKKGANSREIERIKENPISYLGFIFGSSDNTDNSEKERLLRLEAERRKLQEAKKLIDASRTGSSVGDIPNNIGKGIKDAVLDDGYFDFGMSAMYDNSQLLDIKNKLDDKKPLTEDEQRLLNAAALVQETISTHQDRISPWYTAGQTTANMIPFMAEMAINPAAGLGKAAQKAVVRKISSVVGKSLTKKMLPKLARTTGDVVGASIMTGTTGAMRTIADTENRMLGEVDSSVNDGKIIGDGFSGGLDKLEASGKAFAANTIENWSEMLGEYFAPALKGAGYVAGKGMRKMGMGKVMDFISDVNSTPVAKCLDDILEQTQWSGPIGEIAEEEAGIIANSYITGDNELSDLVDPKQQLDIVLGVGLFGGFVSGIKTINYRTPEKRAERDFHKSEENASSMFDNWEDLRSKIDDADETELPEVINTIAKSDVVGDDRNKKAAIIDYAYSLQKWRGENAAEMKQGVENPEITQELTNEEGDIVDLEEGNPTPVDKVNVYRDFVRAGRKAKQVLPEEIISKLPSVTDVERFIAEKNLNDAQKEAANAYLNAYGQFSVYQGDVLNRRQEVANTTREQAINDVERISNQDTGSVVQVKNKFLDNPVYLVGGRLSFGEDGLLDIENSDDRVYYLDEDGNRKMAPANDFDSVLSDDAKEDVIGMRLQDADQQFIQEEEASLNTPDIPAPERGDRVVINGDTYLIEEQDIDVPRGVLAVKLDTNGAIDVNNGRQVSLSADEYYSAKEAELWGEQPKEEQSIESSEDASIAEEPIIMLQNEVENDNAALSEESNVSQSEEVLEENIPSIPSDDKGNLLYHRAPVEVTIDAINREELEPDEIDSFVSVNKEASAKLVSNLENKPPKMGTSIAKYKADKLAWSDRLSDAKAQVDYWDAVSEEIAASRVQPGDKTAEAILSMGEPLTGEELAAAMLGTGRLPVLYDSYKKETGGHNAEARGMVGLFASKANGGMTIEEAGEQLMLADQENGTNFFDSNDPNAGRNAIIGVLSGARTRGDLFNYIQRNREQMAERERQAEYDAYSSWTEDNFGMTPEDYEAYEEQAPASIAERFKDFDEEDFYNNIANELNEEQREVAGVTESSEVLQGEGIVSPERIETSNDEGGAVPVGSESSSEDGAVLEETRVDNQDFGTTEVENTEISDEQGATEVRENEQYKFSAPQLAPGESVLDYADRIADSKRVFDARQEVDANPTNAQKEAGNYKKGHVRVDSYDISIENPKGSERSGVDANGQPWNITMNNSYGYIRRTEGADGDHIDVFLSDSPSSGNVFIVDQKNEDGSFDEHKVMYGFSSVDEARDAYLANYSPGWKGLGTITEVSKEDFNKWIDSSKRKTKPFSEYKNIATKIEDEAGAIRFQLSEDNAVNAEKQQSSDYERVINLSNAFEEKYQGAGKSFVVKSNDTLRKQLEAIGIPENIIVGIEEKVLSGRGLACYEPHSDRMIIFDTSATNEAINGYLWHENTHSAIDALFGDNAEQVLEPVYQWLSKRHPEACKRVTDLYYTESEASQKEECVVWYFEQMYSRHGEEKLEELISNANSQVKETFERIFNKIVYGTKEVQSGTGRVRNDGGSANAVAGTETFGMVHNSEHTELEGKTRENRDAEEESRNRRTNREYFSKGEARFRIGEETAQTEKSQPDGTREAYEKAVNTKGRGGKAQLSAYNFQEAFQDETLSVKILQKIIEEHSGETLKGYENAYQAENRLGSMNLRQRNKFIEELYEPMMKIVDGIMKKGVSEKEIKHYLIAKSGLERNREFAVRDAIAAEEKDNGKESAQKLRKQYVENRNNLRQQHADGKLNWDEYQDKLDELAALYASKFSDYSGLTAITGDETHFTDLAKDIVKNFEANHETKALWNSIDATTKYSLKKSYESGIMGKEAYNHVNDMFEYYIPMRGWNEETAEDVYDYIRQERGTFSATIEKASGHQHESYEPFAIIGNMAESAILQGNRNLMKQKFMNMVMNHPSDVATLSQVWFKKNTKGEWEASFPNIANDATADKVAQTIEEHEKEMLELEKDGKAEYRSNKLDINYHIDPKNISQHAVVVKRGGKDYVIYINGNPRAAEALNGKLKSGKQNIAWDFYDYLKRQYAAGMTSYNVNFVGANVARDVQHAFFITYLDKGVKSSARLAKNGPKALKIVARGVSGKLDLNRKEDNYYKEFLENGGETGYSNLNSIEAWKADNDKRMSRLKGLSKSTGYVKEGLKHLADWFEFANRIAENSTRFNAYMLAREDGKGVGEAINEAKNITVNFNKKGSGQTPGLYGAAANIFRRWVLFANPIIQGLYQVAHIGNEHKARLASAWALHTSMGFAVPMLNAMLVGMYGGDDDDYFNQNDYTRRNNLMLYIPKIGYLKIPLAPVFRNMYAMGDILYMKTHNLSTAEDVFFDSINEARAMLSLEGQSGRKEWDPGRFIAPDLVGPILDIKENENFAGSPIYKSTEFNKLDPEFKKIYKDAWTPLVELSQTLNSVGGNDYRKSEYFGKWINPAAMQHLITNYTGGVGQLIGDFSSVLSDAFSGKIVENFDVMKVPVVKRFFTIPNERTSGTAIRRKYFKIKDEMDALNHEVRERAKSVGSDLRLTNKLSELQNSDEYNNLLVFEGFAKQIAAEETPEKKAELMKTFIEWYDKEKKKQKKQK